ncbi:MAG: proteasome subunit beta [Actinomycetota bacterium]
MTDRTHPPVSGAAFGANPSFVDLLRQAQPQSVPASFTQPVNAADVPIPHGTTVLGLKYADGVIMAGDRRATAGYTVADPKMRKVFEADDYSAIAIAGAAGQAIEMVKLFQLELEHYEKITGDRLSLEGKANRLAQMIRSNFPLAMQGLVVVPLFGGFDVGRGEGRIFFYDATGGRWEEDDYQTTGSGGQPAKNSLKKRWRPGLARDEALRVAVEALVDAAEDDVATGGPDVARGIFPIAVDVTAVGASDVPEEQVAAAVAAVLEGRS